MTISSLLNLCTLCKFIICVFHYVLMSNFTLDIPIITLFYIICENYGLALWPKSYHLLFYFSSIIKLVFCLFIVKVAAFFPVRGLLGQESASNQPPWLHP